MPTVYKVTMREAHTSDRRVRRLKKKSTSSRTRTAASKSTPDALALLQAYLPAGSRKRSVAKIAAAAGGALIAAAVLGVGPAALAGAAGYLMYREARR